MSGCHSAQQGAPLTQEFLDRGRVNQTSQEIHPGEKRLDDLFVNRCCLHETSLRGGGLPVPWKMSILGIYNAHERR